MGEMKINTKPDVRPVKKRPYKLAHKYKEIVKKEIDNMLEAGIIYPIDQSEWASLSADSVDSTRDSGIRKQENH